ncbi:MAG TPA: type II toxin-antitoxin system HicB family antitoxin [Beijerinckiaceae bacterium]|nr:type II toxin-antitoxin system HicB family antitoxin [Beijerinckiaceae bacterium]
MSGYVALIHPPAGRARVWGVTFPDLPGCTSAGKCFAEAAHNAREALSGHLAAMRDDGDAIPAPRSLEALRAASLKEADVAEELDGAIPQYVTPRALAGERVRINITLDKSILRRADERAEADGTTRSRLIEDALLERIGED